MDVNEDSFDNLGIDIEINDDDLLETDPSEFEEFEDEDGICDCDPEYKETHVIQESAGAMLGGLGGQFESGTTVIICKNCGGRYYEN